MKQPQGSQTSGAFAALDRPGVVLNGFLVCASSLFGFLMLGGGGFRFETFFLPGIVAGDPGDVGSGIHRQKRKNALLAIEQKCIWLVS